MEKLWYKSSEVAAMGSGAARILVVDDSDATRQYVCGALEDAGFETEAARSGFEALKLLAAGTFDLVVTDINMPDLTGLEVIKFCQTARPGLPVIVISTDRAQEDRRRALELGAVGYLAKPFGPEELVEMCLRHLSGGEAESS